MDRIERKERILSFKKLKKNWDSYGAEPISKENIALALKISDFLGDEDYFVAPTPSDGISFELNEKHIFVYVRNKKWIK